MQAPSASRAVPSPASAPEPFPLLLFFGSFATYWAIGELIQGFHGHDFYNYFFNARGAFRGDRTRLGLRLLCAGWMVGVFGLFTFFGDDLMLYSELLVGHVVLFVAVGLAEFVRDEHLRFWKAGGVLFLTLLAWNNARFVVEMLARYQT